MIATLVHGMSVDCDYCAATGQIISGDACHTPEQSHPCPDCGGRGYVVFCEPCGGTYHEPGCQEHLREVA